MKSGKTAPRFPPRKRREGRLCKRAGGCEGYPEGTNCSGVRRWVLPAHILPTHTRSQTHIHTHAHRPGPKCTNNPANCTPHPPITTNSPPPPTTPEDPIWNQSTATTLVPSLPCCGPARVYFTELETWDDCALDTKTDRTSQCLEVKMRVKAVSCLGIFVFF